MNTNRIENLHNQHIVGIGASAGGLEAILELFDNMPHDLDCSFVIIQHLSPDYKSMMPELLEKHTKMPIFEAAHGMQVAPNTIYVMPHKTNMTFSKGHLLLTQKEPSRTPNMAIDHFFKSLAEDKKQKAIGVLLSGTGTDGTKGLEAIKKCNGLAIVQDPLTSRFDGMPNSAIQAGFADYILPPELIQEELIHYIQGPESEKGSNASMNDMDESILLDILGMVKSKIGSDFSLYKRPTVMRRLSKRMSAMNIKTIQEYKEYVFKKPEELQLLYKDFLIGVTRFFRDPKSFEKIYDTILPEIFKSKAPEQEVKIWVAGCSTGEEAYTMAILVCDYLAKTKINVDVKIFATDIDKDAIDTATKGCFPLSIAQDVSPQRLKDHFELVGNKYKILPHVRKLVVFAQHDLIRNAPFSKVDLISCRNVLIYLSPVLQKTILGKFHFGLNKGGFLFLGPSENLGDYDNIFIEHDKKWKIYQNPVFGKSKSIESFGLFPTMQVNSIEALGMARTDKGHHSSLTRSQALNDILLKESQISAVYVNDNFELLQASGNYHTYLQLPDNHLDLNLTKMVPDELSIALTSVLRKASKLNDRVTLSGIRLKKESSSPTLDLVVIPSTDKKTLKKSYWILFKEIHNEDNEKRNAIPFSPGDITALEHASEMEYELRETKERLQSAIEELETSNEEMQSANEELVSANEELQSTNEELQSLNEELHTVNSEHQVKIKELIELNDDLNNYFRSTDIGQVFLDKNLAIRKFTPAIVQQINLIDSDIGRPILHISNNIQYGDLHADIKKALANNEGVEKEITTKDGKWFLMKILPYIRQDKSIEGAIITFVDINHLKTLNQLISGVLNSSISAILAFRAIRNPKEEIVDFECVLGNDSCEKVLGKKFQDMMGKRMLSEVIHKHHNLFHRYKEVVDTGRPLHIEFFDDVTHRWLEIAAVKMEDGVAVTFQDITDKKNAEEKIRIAYDELKKAQATLRNLNNELEARVEERTRDLSLSEQRFKTLSLATNDAIWDWDFATNKVWWNEGFKNMFGYTDAQLDGGVEAWFNRIHPDDKKVVIEGIQEVIASGNKTWAGEYRLQKADGTYSTILDRAYVLRHEDQMPYRMIGSMMDLTNLKRVQTELELTNANLLKINADLDNFIYTASHDLKAPIANIEGLMYALQEIVSTDNLEIRNILDMVNVSLRKFKETIEGLTEVVKIQKENAQEPELLDLKELINDVVMSIKDMVVKSNATITYDLQKENVQFAKKNLRSIFYNLISNSIKYRQPNQNPEIKISTEVVDDYTVIHVQDNGLGIEESKLPKIFGMFKRLHTHVDGTGIGLYIVKRIIENAEGRIEVTSKPNVGTTFHIYLKNMAYPQTELHAHDLAKN